MPCELDGQRARRLLQASLRDVVGAQLLAEAAMHRGDVNDAAVAAL